MSEQTGISWCDHTFNPWWGCVKVSPACTNCYAETFSNRLGLKVWGNDSDRRFFGPKHWAEPLKWNAKAEKAGETRRVFCASMADVFEDRTDLIRPRMDLFLTIEETPALDWLLLTKRPENIIRLLPTWWHRKAGRNVWLGTTVENQEYADVRIPYLLDVPAVVHFVSYEPAVGPIDFQSPVLEADCAGAIDWVIAGGESGPHARPSHPEWFRSVRDQCQSAGVAFHFKQWGEWAPYREDWPLNHEDSGVFTDGLFVQDGSTNSWDAEMTRYGKKRAGRELDGREWNEFPEVHR